MIMHLPAVRLRTYFSLLSDGQMSFSIDGQQQQRSAIFTCVCTCVSVCLLNLAEWLVGLGQ
jgi:hypothetical protein